MIFWLQRGRECPSARGVKAIELSESDEVVGMAVLKEDGTVLTVSETGYGRRSEVTDYRLQSRAGKGTINYHTEKYGDVAESVPGGRGLPETGVKISQIAS